MYCLSPFDFDWLCLWVVTAEQSNDFYLDSSLSFYIFLLIMVAFNTILFCTCVCRRVPRMWFGCGIILSDCCCCRSLSFRIVSMRYTMQCACACRHMFACVPINMRVTRSIQFTLTVARTNEKLCLCRMCSANFYLRCVEKTSSTAFFSCFVASRCFFRFFVRILI